MRLSTEKNNKTGSSQVGAISKAQKYSKNNYWKHLEKLFFSKKKFEKFFFEKSIFLESRTMPKNSKRCHSGSLNVFTNRKLQKNARGYPLQNPKIFEKKSHSAEKNPKGGPFGLTCCTFGSIKILWFSARIEPPLSGLEDEHKYER